MKKSVLALFVVAVLLFAGCGPIPTTDPSNTGNPSEPSYPAAEVVVLENDYIKVSYKGVTDMPSLGVFYLNLKIENKTDKEILVALESADVDSETIPVIATGVPVCIRPGNSGVGAFIFSMKNLSIDSVKDAEKASFKIVIMEEESLDTMFTSEIVTVELN